MDRVPETREDMSYTVFWLDNNQKDPQYHLENIIANDHEDAVSQILKKEEAFEVLLVMKGEPLILWQA